MTYRIKHGALLLSVICIVVGHIYGIAESGSFPLDAKDGGEMEILMDRPYLNSDSAISSSTWTFMIYLDADNDLEPYGLEDFLDASSVIQSGPINVLVQMDRVAGYSGDYGDWKICHRFVLSPGMTPQESNAVSDWGDGAGGREVDMGDPKTLTNFINWGTTNYPALHYSVILWDHGEGWRNASQTPYRAICHDATSNDYLYTCEMREALESVPCFLDIIGMDACLMSMLEVGYEIRKEGGILVASEANIPVDGWPYDLIFQDMCSSATLGPVESAKMMVRRYGEHYNMDNTLSSTDLTQMDAIAQALSALCSSIMDDNQHWPCAAVARNAASSYDTLERYRDLRGFVQALDECATNETIRDKAEALRDILDNASIANHCPAYLPSHGLSIYFPDPHKTYIDGGYICPNIQFACDTNWLDFLIAYLSADAVPPSIEHTPLSDTLETSGPYHLEANIQDASGIRDVKVWWKKNGAWSGKRIMRKLNDNYVLDIPGPAQPGDHFCYRIEARDIPGNISYYPGPGPDIFRCFDIGDDLEGLWEEFNGFTSVFDLDYKRVTFLPNPLAPGRYQTCVEAISDWSVNPEGGSSLPLGDDKYAFLDITTSPVWLYGNPYSRIYVGSNGYITFTQGDMEYSPTANQHFRLPRISPIFADLNPPAGGSVSYKELADRMVVSFQDIREYDKTEKNNFQVEMFYHGGIRMSYLDMGVTKGITGLSNGQGIPTGMEIDYSTIGTCSSVSPPHVEIQTPGESGPGYIQIPYTLYDENANPCHIRILYSKGAGSSWFPTADAPGGEKRWGLESSPAGVNHVYVWNSLPDLGEGLCDSVKIRMIPYNSQTSGSSSETGIFTVFNPSRIEIKGYLLNMDSLTAIDTEKLDINKDGLVDIADLIMVINNVL